MKGWSYQDRTRYEAALRRAARELLVASDVASDNGDDMSAVCIGGHVIRIEELRSESIARGTKPMPPAPLKGQTSIAG